MTDWEGNISQPKDHLLVEEVEDNTIMALMVKVGSLELVDIDAVLVETSPLLDPMFLSACLEEHARLGKFQLAIGVTTINDDDTPCLVLDSELLYSSDSNMDTSDDEDSDSGHTNGFNPNIFMASAMHAWPCKDVNMEHLSKVW